MSIELNDEDLLDIDGSDDPTAAFSGRAVLAKLRAPARKKRAPVDVVHPAPAPMPAHFARPVDDPTIVMGADREDIRETIPVPMRLAATFTPSAPPAAAAPVPASIAPKSPTISPAPPVRTRNANSSYPPIAINNLGPHRERMMSFVSERPSRAGWITAAVMGVLILVGGSIKVAAPKAAPAAPPPAVAAAEPAAPAEAPEEPKVVTFGDSQGVSIKAKPEAKDAKADTKDAKADAKDAKPEPKKAAPAPHVVTVKPVVKPAAPTKADTSLAASKDKDEKIPSTSHDGPSPSSNMSKADQKKLRSIEQDLADLQLKAAAR